jgi:hypothetical protein
VACQLYTARGIARCTHDLFVSDVAQLDHVAAFVRLDDYFLAVQMPPGASWRSAALQRSRRIVLQRSAPCCNAARHIATLRGAAGSSALSLSVSDDDGVTFTKARFPTDLKQQRYDDCALGFAEAKQKHMRTGS